MPHLLCLTLFNYKTQAIVVAKKSVDSTLEKKAAPVHGGLDLISHPVSFICYDHTHRV